MGLFYTSVKELLGLLLAAARGAAEATAGRKRLLLMLDYDGTLVPFAPQPYLAQPGSEELEVLQQVAEREGIALAVISGRSLYDLEAMLPVEGVFLAGWHGAVLREPGGKARWLVDPSLCRTVMQVRERIKEVEAAGGGWPQGFWIEDKELSLAVHFRQALEKEAQMALERLLAAVAPLLEEHNLETLAGARVVEIRPRGVNKGKAVEILLQMHPGYYPVYLGDDITDEDAFSALRGKGLGVRVGEEERPSAASCRLRSCQEVVDFLRKLAAHW